MSEAVKNLQLPFDDQVFPVRKEWKTVGFVEYRLLVGAIDLAEVNTIIIHHFERSTNNIQVNIISEVNIIENHHIFLQAHQPATFPLVMGKRFHFFPA